MLSLTPPDLSFDSNVLLESLPDAFQAFDSTWRYVYLNARAEQVLGKKREQLLGKVCWTEHPETVGTLFHGRCVEARKTGRAVVFETFNSDEESWAEFSLHPYLGGLGVFQRDITLRKHVEKAAALTAGVAEKHDTLDTVNQVGRLLSAELDLQKLVQAATDAATKLTGAQMGAFFYNVVDERGEAYTLYSLSGVPHEAFSSFPHPRATHLFGPTFRAEGIIRSGDIRHDPRYGKMAPHFGVPEGHLPVRSFLAVPVVSRSGEVLGGLFFGHADPDVFSEQAERNIEALAAQTAVAVDNARLFGQAQREIAERRKAEATLARQARFAALRADISAALAEGGSLQEMLQRCAEPLVQQLDAAFARIWTLDEQENVLLLQASAGLYTHVNGPHGRVPVGQKKIGLIAQEKKAHLTNDVLGDDRIGEKAWAQREGMVAFAGYPLLLEDRVVGVVALFARHVLSNDTLDELAAIADALAQGVARKRVEQRLADSEARQRGLMRDVLASVTGGRLRLCDTPADLPPPLAECGEPISLGLKSLRFIRQRAITAVQQAGLDQDRGNDFLTAVGEATQNAVRHAGGGISRVCVDADAGVVQVWVEDQGGGIAVERLPQATLERGYTGGNGFGHGFWLMLQTVDRVWLLTSTEGTTVVVEQGRAEPVPGWLSKEYK